jgi:predicted HTH domain antitoxin
VQALANAGIGLAEIAELAERERDAAMMEALRQEAPWIIRARAGRNGYGSRELEETIAETMAIVESHADAFRGRDGLQLRETMRELRQRGEEIDALAKVAAAEVKGEGVAAARLEAGFTLDDVAKAPAARPSNGLVGDASDVLAGSGAKGVGTTMTEER